MGIINADPVSSGSWTINSGSGTFEEGYMTGSPYVIFQRDYNISYNLDMSNVTLELENLNASSWSMFLRLETTLYEVWVNETGSGNYTRTINQAGSWSAILLRVDNGTVHFKQLNIEPGTSPSAVLARLDIWFFSLMDVNPWLEPMGLIGVLAVMAILLMIDKRRF